MEETVKSVERAFQVLEQVSQAKNGAGITELAHELHMHKSTVHRMLTTLVHVGYVEQTAGTGRYKLGYKLLEIATRLLDGLDVRREALPHLQTLAELTHEVVHLVVLDSGQVVYIEKVEGSETIRMHSRVGACAPVHCTGVGKAILAYLPETTVRAIIGQYGLAPHTPHTLTTEEALFAELARIRERGCAFDREENELGITCVAAPIWDHTGEVVAAVSISSPTMRMHSERLDRLVEHVRDTGLHISARLGCRRIPLRNR